MKALLHLGLVACEKTGLLKGGGKLLLQVFLTNAIILRGTTYKAEAFNVHK